MIKVYYGNKGMGKTKALVEAANELVGKSSGDIVFVDDSSQLMYDLKHEIRFINVVEFPVRMCSSTFLGFICGVISEDFDIEGFFIDGLTYIVDKEAGGLEEFFSSLRGISEKFNINFYISINGETSNVPDYLKEFIA